MCEMMGDDAVLRCSCTSQVVATYCMSKLEFMVQILLGAVTSKNGCSRKFTSLE